MNPRTVTDLERALQRYGDDLYRLALLLNDSPGQAAQNMLAAARRLAGTASPTEPELIAALVASLPREAVARRLQRTPQWVKLAAQHSEQAGLLGALARLPRPARLALGLAMLRTYEPAQIAPLLGRDEQGARDQIRDALLALAAHVPGIQDGQPLAEEPPEDCRATRAAIALADPRLHTDAAIRGHLALCSACRSAEQRWFKLTATVEEALRGALRDVRLPNQLSDQLRDATQPQAAHGPQRWLADPRVRIALVTLPVLVFIAILVWPRSSAPASSSGTASGAGLAQAPAPMDLVRRAQTQLYVPPEGSGTWHSQYAIQWSFLDGSYAMLNADEWLDPAGGRHRLQLVHHSGGGPYEYELADGTQSIWYAAGATYAASISPVEADASELRSRYQASAEQRNALLQARLQSGAWDIAANYLHQATAAELHTWGRQRDGEGRLLDLISFAGTSPLALPADAPNATTSKITVLLAIDEASGRLREVRELFGAAGAEQTARTTWQVLSEEWISDQEQANQIFDHGRAWNGIGEFVDREAPLDAAHPLIQADALAGPTQLLQVDRSGVFMPATPPAGSTSALLLNQAPGTIAPGGDTNVYTLVYSGGGRQIAIRSVRLDARLSRLEQSETVTVGNARAQLKAQPDQSYRAVLFHNSEQTDEQNQIVTQVRTIGYTRADLIAQLQSLAPPALGAIQAQAQLFIERRPHDAAWQALIGALADPQQPPAGSARHFVERGFSRHSPLPDRLPDPYHRPPYAGWPEHTVSENWARGSLISGTIETAAVIRDEAGHIYARQYRSTKLGWDYDAGPSRISEYLGQNFTPGINEDQLTVLRMLDCGGAKLGQGADGTRSLVLAERDWHGQSCQNPRYPILWQAQTTPGGRQFDESPYFADQSADELTTVITLGADGRPARTEVWAGSPQAGVLLQAWERVSEEIIAADRLAPDIFSPQPPSADIRLSFPSSDVVTQNIDTSLPHATDLSVAIQEARSPFVGFRQDVGAPYLYNIILGNQPEQLQTNAFTIDNSVFNGALNSGYAIYSVYNITGTEGLEQFNLYQGPAAKLGAYLRNSADWATSAPTTLQIGGQAISGWQVIERNTGMPWLLFELDGTLVAIEKPTPGTLPQIEHLQRLDSPSP